ncbi:MAG: nickel pincer cofactor biosynthesis protein LarC [Thermodesulfobacteriota bacterium]
MIFAYTDTFSGISGDMFIGALLHAGLPLATLKSQLAALPLAGYELAAEQIIQQGLSATRFTVHVREEDRHHRSWRTIRSMLAESGLAAPVRERALAIFTVLAEAEARVHGCPVDEVHFHELGGIDAIIDITGAAIGMAYFGIYHLVSAPLPLTRGWTRCSHGVIPLPAPAVTELTKGMAVYGVDLDQELVTPTGAAILKGCCRTFGPLPPMRIAGLGYGAGSRVRRDGRPNLLRLIIGEALTVAEEQEVVVIETHLDDWQPEGFPFLCEKLLAGSALDVALIPMQMKKGRPGFLLRVVAAPDLAWEAQRLILEETSAIGLRYRREGRWTLPRQSGFIVTRAGRVAVKKVTTPMGRTVLSPEYEQCRQLAAEKEIPLREIYALVAAATPDDFQEE